IALSEMGYNATALSGRQAGIVTDGKHTQARIEHIDTKTIKDELKQGKIVVVAGFQGITQIGEVSTLGRGGSDLSAVAIAGALRADICEIYTDVDGIYTTDPRIEPKAKKLKVISYDEMLELASLGAKVLQARSVELAKKLNVNLVTRSSFNEDEGTYILREEDIMEKPLVSGIAIDKNQARVTLRGVTDKPGIAADIFRKLASEGVNVDMIIQNVGVDGSTNLGFTIPQDELEITDKAMRDIGASKSVEFDKNVVKVSVVGVGMKSHSGVACTAFDTLADENINIEMISTSEIKVSMIISEKYGELAVRALHDAYKLDN
ncbi:MAG: aspartate kinase, partial [Campylobacteraceae bacterium]|nr:aspartate kinase [Campylobacteraceae bacterium]